MKTQEKVSTQQSLEGVRILDLSRYIAGPHCSLLLGDMGAEVIKIEPPGGESTRQVEPLIEDTGTYFLKYNRNKKSITLNLRTDKAKEIFRDLVPHSDVILQNFRPGVMEKIGFGFPMVRELNPGIIMVSVSAFGQDGPYAGWGGFDWIIQAMSGLMSLTGSVEGPPMVTGTFISDYVTAMYAAFGTLTALYHRERTGVGQLVDVSMLDSTFSLLMTTVVDYLALGLEPRRMGNQDRYGAPANSYRCKDGYINVDASLDSFFLKLLDVMGREELVENPRISTMETRLENHYALDAIVEEWTSQHTREEVEHLLVDVGVPAGPVRSIAEVANCPQLQHRNQIVEVEHHQLGKIRLPGVTVKLSETPGTIRLPPPQIGQHNEEVFCDLLGYSPDELAMWKEEGTI